MSKSDTPSRDGHFLLPDSDGGRNTAIFSECGDGQTTLTGALNVDCDMQRRWVIQPGQSLRVADAAAENSAL
ncbi:hypothetical protein ACUTRI_23305 [Serratia sp. TSA_130.2]|uniref:hypothetical protein n=1 Tax=Serratia TaxID=613 RepID=UPI0021A3F1EB|nr:hypothetical protein [Serratia ureilytica]MCT2272592.1 hypothetical protein [Serratia ureilytica]